MRDGGNAPKLQHCCSTVNDYFVLCCAMPKVWMSLPDINTDFRPDLHSGRMEIKRKA